MKGLVAFDQENQTVNTDMKLWGQLSNTFDLFGYRHGIVSMAYWYNP